MWSWTSSNTSAVLSIGLLYGSLWVFFKLSYMVNWDWDRNLSFDVSLETWHTWLHAAFWGCLYVSLVETILKVLTQWDLIPASLAKKYGGSSLWCFYCCFMKGTMHHIWWECLCIRGYWNRGFSLLHCLFGNNILLYWMRPFLISLAANTG